MTFLAPEWEAREDDQAADDGADGRDYCALSSSSSLSSLSSSSAETASESAEDSASTEDSASASDSESAGEAAGLVGKSFNTSASGLSSGSSS